MPGMNQMNQPPQMPMPQPAPPQPAGRGNAHGRRHSVNVLAKGHQPQQSMGGYNFYNEGYDEGFAPPAHSRQASRADSSWRISECIFTQGVRIMF
jgi:protein SSD1